MPNTKPRYPTVAQIIEYLFRTYAQTHGQRPKYRQVANAMSAGHDYVFKLHNGTITNPGREAILELASYFGETPMIFFPEFWDTHDPAISEQFRRVMDE